MEVGGFCDIDSSRIIHEPALEREGTTSCTEPSVGVCFNQGKVSIDSTANWGGKQVGGHWNRLIHVSQGAVDVPGCCEGCSSSSRPACPSSLGSRLDWEMLHLTSCCLEWGDQL